MLLKNFDSNTWLDALWLSGARHHLDSTSLFSLPSSIPPLHRLQISQIFCWLVYRLIHYSKSIANQFLFPSYANLSWWFKCTLSCVCSDSLWRKLSKRELRHPLCNKHYCSNLSMLVGGLSNGNNAKCGTSSAKGAHLFHNTKGCTVFKGYNDVWCPRRSIRRIADSFSGSVGVICVFSAIVDIWSLTVSILKNFQQSIQENHSES